MTSYAIRLLLTALLLLGGLPALAQEASVVDGDTIKLGGVTYRLFGIDAPEKNQHCQRDGVPWLCGQEAGARLRALLQGKAVTCREKDRDRYGRVVGVCFAGGQDVNREMVRSGMARAYVQYGADYADSEMEAQFARVGLWADGVVAEAPWDWRRNRRR